MVAKRLWNLKDLVLSRDAKFFAVEVQFASSWDIAQEGLEMTEFNYRAQGSKRGCKVPQSDPGRELLEPGPDLFPGYQCLYK